MNSLNLPDDERADRELRESEQHFRQLVESINRVFFLTNRDNSQVLYVSPAYEQIWGRSCASLYADPASWADLIYPEDRASVLASNQPGSREAGFDLEYRIVRPDGAIRWIRSHGFPIRDESGTVYRIAATAEDITEHKLAQHELHASQQSLSSMITSAMDAIVMVNEANLIVLFNPAAERMFGYTAAELQGKPLGLLLPERFRAEHRRQVAAFGDHGTTKRRMGAFGFVHGVRKNGEEFPIEVSISRDHSNGKHSYTAILRDITERMEQERKITRLNRIQAVISGITSAMLRLRDRTELLQEVCRVCVRDGVFPLAWVVSIDPVTKQSEILAFDSNDATAIDLVKSALSTVPVGELPSYRAARTACAVIANDILSELALKPMAGELIRYGISSCAAFPLIVDRHVCAVMVFLATEKGFFDNEEVALLKLLTEDISYALAYIEKSQRLDNLAYYDSLTTLANTHLFQDRLEQFISAARQNAGQVCVVIIDLENFTRINDSLGRNTGDNLLRAVGGRLWQRLVEPYALGRIAGDTFAAASPCNDDPASTKLLDVMLDAFKQPFNIDGNEIHVSIQAGIAFFPNDGADGSSVFKCAEVALKLAKSSGDRYIYYSSEMHARMAQRLALEEQLRAAIDTLQFDLHYQARVDMISGQMVGAEALVRWQHPERGLVAPGEFIAFAEETGLIVPIGEWVIDRVCAQQATWIAAGIAIVPIAVNVSAAQLETGNLVQIVRDALATHSLDAKCLELELTESATMANPEAATQSLQILSKLGVRLALDDFGTGYSSLAHLKRFPFDSVKIDLSFVTDITTNPEDAAIAGAIIAMAHRLGLNVIAEGVETQGQFNYLRGLGCNEMQGFFFSPAVAKEEFETQLRTGKFINLPAATLEDKRSLLLVDDEPGIRSALMRTLRRDGYHILSAASGPEALEILALNPVQVIISDQRMPKMSGTEFLNVVKQLYPDTMRIILSGYTDLDVVTDSVNRGAVFKFLTKPWDDKLLREQVRDAFARYRPESTRN